MVQPPGFPSGTNTSIVCRLKKSLYGLKQAPRAWNAKITRSQTPSKSKSKSNSSLLVGTNQTRPLRIWLYVEDLVIAGADLGEICHVKSQLAASLRYTTILSASVSSPVRSNFSMFRRIVRMSTSSPRQVTAILGCAWVAAP